MQIFRVRDESEAKKKVKRRLKRLREKAAASQSTEEEESAAVLLDAKAPGGSLPATSVTLTDHMELLHTIRCASRVRGFSFSPHVTQSSVAGSSVKALVGLITNSLEVYSVPLGGNSREEESQAAAAPPSKVSVIDMHGHRSDVRGVSVSSDGSTVATCSNEGVKVSGMSSF